MAKEIGKIIVPVDGSEESKKAAKKAIYIAK
ncbi:MAG: universal stress protein, partial [Thermoplasmata archaeon]